MSRKIGDSGIKKSPHWDVINTLSKNDYKNEITLGADVSLHIFH